MDLGRMNTNLIIGQAHMHMLGNIGHVNSQRNRRRIKLEQKLKEWNKITVDLPRECTNKRSENWIWNRTFEAKEIFLIVRFQRKSFGVNLILIISSGVV